MSTGGPGPGRRPWSSTPANVAPGPQLNLSGISAVATRELEEGELSQTSNSHQMSLGSDLSMVESSKAVFRGQTEECSGGIGSPFQSENLGSLSGWAGDRETSDAGIDSSKRFIRTPSGENNDSSKNIGGRGDSSFLFSLPPQQSFRKASQSSVPSWSHPDISKPSLPRLPQAREEPDSAEGMSFDSLSRGTWQAGLNAARGRSVTFGLEPVFNIYEREESFDLSAAGNQLSVNDTHFPANVPPSPLTLSSPDMFAVSQVEENLPIDDVFKRPLAPSTRVFAASSPVALHAGERAAIESTFQGVSQVTVIHYKQPL